MIFFFTAEQEQQEKNMNGEFDFFTTNQNDDVQPLLLKFWLETIKKFYRYQFLFISFTQNPDDPLTTSSSGLCALLSPF